jgi:hypothetical protein
MTLLLALPAIAWLLWVVGRSIERLEERVSRIEKYLGIGSRDRAHDDF